MLGLDYRTKAHAGRRCSYHLVLRFFSCTDSRMLRIGIRWNLEVDPRKCWPHHPTKKTANNKISVFNLHGPILDYLTPNNISSQQKVLQRNFLPLITGYKLHLHRITNERPPFHDFRGIAHSADN
jgi:hypothetical protein